MGYDFKDVVIVGRLSAESRWTTHYTATHIPTGLRVNWVASWNDCDYPRAKALAHLENLVFFHQQKEVKAKD